MKRIIIIGGGVTGLGAAYKIRRAADAGHDVECVLVEKEPRLGGKIVTTLVADEWQPTSPDARFVVDGGPDCFLTEKPAVHRIARMTGCYDDELPTDDARKKTLILSRGRLHEMPDGVMMFAPTKFVPFATTGLFSWPGKARMAADLLLPRKERWPEGDMAQQHDETLESFVVRRMGRECLDRLAEPLVGGVHASDPKMMSLAATFPRLLEMEQAHGSLMRGFLAARRKVEAMRAANPPVAGEKPRTFFTSFVGGMAQLIDRMADAAGRDALLTGAPVERLASTGDGSYHLRLADGSRLDGDAVIVATESWAAQRLLAGLDDEIASNLAAIPTSSSATVSIAFHEDEVGVDMDAFGVLCPLVEGRALLALTYSSTKWPGRAPSGKVLFRGFLGGPHDQAMLKRADEELIEVMLSEMREVVGLSSAAEPLFARVFRWEGGMPQYTLGHLDRVASIERRCAATPGLALAGGSYRGVGVPNCIESGERAVTKVFADWGLSFDEDVPKAEGG